MSKSQTFLISFLPRIKLSEVFSTHNVSFVYIIILPETLLKINCLLNVKKMQTLRNKIDVYLAVYLYIQLLRGS